MARFFDVLTARPLTTAEMRHVARLLGCEDSSSHPGLVAFRAQPVADQRHGYRAATYVAARRPDRPDLVRAALLHDVGKRHARLGPIGRVVASLALRLGIPVGGRVALYRDHGELAAAELADEESIVVDYARHHHGTRPETIDPGDWDLLVSSDRSTVSLSGRGGGR